MSITIMQESKYLNMSINVSTKFLQNYLLVKSECGGLTA